MKSWPQTIQAVLLDVDGTLYHQGMLRALMATEIASFPFMAGSINRAYHVLRILKCFRKGREELRSSNMPVMPLVDLQYHVVGERTGMSPNAVETVVREWIYQRPLKYLRFCKRRGMQEFFNLVSEKGLRTGVFSDYPVRAKLQQLGIQTPLSVELCATDPEINAFKPNPKGFLRACQLWDLDPCEVLYVGDRPEVDASGANAAGMPCVIFSRSRSRENNRASGWQYSSISSFGGLRGIIDSKL